MANKYCNLVGTKKISEDFNNINIGFDKVQQDMDTKGTPADAQVKADAARDAAIAAAAAALTAHKERGADEHPTAKGNAAGFMSASDYTKLNASTPAATPGALAQRDAAGRMKAAAPDSADDVARKAEVDAVQADLDDHKADKVVHVTQDDHDKLGSIEEGAEVNQLAFSKVNDVSAKSKSDSLKIKGGIGITVTSNPDTNEVTVTATGDATPGKHAETHLPGGTDVIPFATVSVGGLMSEQDKKDIEQLKTQQGQTANKLDDHLKSTAAHAAAAIAVDDPEFTDKNVLGVLKYLKSLANSIKTKVAAAIGSPARGGDSGDQLAQKVNDAKAVGASNLVAKGVSATATESLATLFGKISNIIKGSGNAQPPEVLTGKTFTNDGGVPLTGTMPFRSAENVHMPSTAHTVWAGDRVFLQPPFGYYDGASWVTAPAPHLKPENILKEANILGVQGTAQKAAGTTNLAPNFWSSINYNRIVQGRYYFRDGLIYSGFTESVENYNTRYGLRKVDYNGTIVYEREYGRGSLDIRGFMMGAIAAPNLMAVIKGWEEILVYDDNGNLTHRIPHKNLNLTDVSDMIRARGNVYYFEARNGNLHDSSGTIVASFGQYTQSANSYAAYFVDENTLVRDGYGGSGTMRWNGSQWVADTRHFDAAHMALYLAALAAR
ncbi:hypothetical protein [Paenibacillus sp. NAIST15-1]|uniref:hypothetical protein n=1 Tax=Paenibacillus sp. NAIST15-1 TaxID=1605994 RepID=UPI00086C9693|nr:hypothetical protein [Paenibacillus sp. NAIST15-1]GAV13227.1 hypothetical protein PBN151_3161 [Paenibacillus sp. NAIST15-1]